MSYLIYFSVISAWLITRPFKHFAEIDWDLKYHTYSLPQNLLTLTKHKKLTYILLLMKGKLILARLNKGGVNCK